MHNRFSATQAAILIGLLSLLLVLVQLGLMRIAMDKLGISMHLGIMLLASSMLGGIVNLPMMRIKAAPPPSATNPDHEPEQFDPKRLLRMSPLPYTGHTLIAINVGGCLVPLVFCASLINRFPLPIGQLLLATTIVSLACYLTSRPIPKLGIGMPPLIAPIVSAIVAISINTELAAPLAYICGVCGVLIGADLLRLRDIAGMGTPVAAIGGAGTFDGIFLTGIVAVLLT